MSKPSNRPPKPTASSATEPTAIPAAVRQRVRPARALESTGSDERDHSSDRDADGVRIGESPTRPSYEVGYGKPPIHTRFKKGQSGNPRGRDKGQKNLTTLFIEEGETLIPVMENGKRKKLPRRIAATKAAWNNFARGKSIDQMLKIYDRAESRGAGSQGRLGGLPNDAQSLSSNDREMLDFFRRRAIEEHAAREPAKDTAAQPGKSTGHASDGPHPGASNGDGPKVDTDSDDDLA